MGEAASAAAEAQIYLLPLLRPHQRLWVVPGLFGPASVAHSPEARTAYDELLVRKLQGWLERKPFRMLQPTRVILKGRRLTPIARPAP